MSYLLVGFLVGLFVSFWIVSALRDETSAVFDSTMVGEQKFHSKPVPRIGGVAVFAGIAVSAAWMWFGTDTQLRNFAVLVLCGVPALAIGLAEDLTKRVPPASRMLGIALSALLAWGIFSSVIDRVGIPWMDGMLKQYTLLALVLTLIAVTGIVNAVNIIDGFHGLALLSAVIMFSGLAVVAWQVEDMLVFYACVSSVGGLLGLFFWNYPQGRIFMGDGGAYFVGFMLAQCAILLFHRNASVSPWCAVLALAYPTTETLFSMYRKAVLRGQSPFQPDRSHLHMLIYGRVVSRMLPNRRRPLSKDERNVRTSPYLWLMTAITVVPACVFYDNSAALMACTLLFALGYWMLYASLVKFRQPRWIFWNSTRARAA